MVRRLIRIRKCEYSHVFFFTIRIRMCEYLKKYICIRIANIRNKHSVLFSFFLVVFSQEWVLVPHPGNIKNLVGFRFQNSIKHFMIELLQ